MSQNNPSLAQSLLVFLPQIVFDDLERDVCILVADSLLVSEVANLRLIPPIVHTPHLKSPMKPTAEQYKEGYYNNVSGYEKYLFQKCVHISLFSGGLILNCVRIGSL